MLLTVNMIVKDEAAALPDALASVHDLADEVVVYDTGSTDMTVAIARRAGARVVEGFWDHDFARARNAALQAASGTWVMPLDADERWEGESAAVRHRLRTAEPGTAFTALITNEGPDRIEGDYAYRRVRFFRRQGARWVRAVHETVEGAAVRRHVDLGTGAAGIRHVGLVDPARVREKGRRNLEIARAEFDRVRHAGVEDVATIGGVLFDLGRSLEACGQYQEAADTYETLRDVAAGTPWFAMATAGLARVLLGQTDDHEAVLVLGQQLQATGAAPQYADWLVANALFRLRLPGEALVLLRGIDHLQDPQGLSHDLGAVLELRAMCAALVGARDEARGCLAAAMAGHGRVEDRGALLLSLWAGLPDAELVGALAAHGSRHRAELADELRRSGARDAAARLTAA